MPRVITGRVEIRVDGESLLIKTGAKAIGIGGYARKPVIGESYHGHVTEASESRCEFTVTDHSEKSLLSLANLTDATLVFEAAEQGGKAYIMRHAVCAANFELTAGEGEVPVAFFGEKWEEQLF